MRILTGVSFLLALYTVNVFAVEPIDEQQLMFYYTIPLGAGSSQDSRHQFGLRLDQVTHTPGQDVPLRSLENKTAAMDFRMTYDGIKSLKIDGVDYASYLIARAAEGETAPATDEPVADTTEGASTETPETPKEETGPITNIVKELPVGFYLGIIIGVGIIAGVGG